MQVGSFRQPFLLQTFARDGQHPIRNIKADHMSRWPYGFRQRDQTVPRPKTDLQNFFTRLRSQLFQPPIAILFLRAAGREVIPAAETVITRSSSFLGAV